MWNGNYPPLYDPKTEGLQHERPIGPCASVHDIFKLLSQKENVWDLSTHLTLSGINEIKEADLSPVRMLDNTLNIDEDFINQQIDESIVTDWEIVKFLSLKVLNTNEKLRLRKLLNNIKENPDTIQMIYKSFWYKVSSQWKWAFQKEFWFKDGKFDPNNFIELCECMLWLSEEFEDAIANEDETLQLPSEIETITFKEIELNDSEKTYLSLTKKIQTAFFPNLKSIAWLDFSSSPLKALFLDNLETIEWTDLWWLSSVETLYLPRLKEGHLPVSFDSMTNLNNLTLPSIIQNQWTQWKILNTRGDRGNIVQRNNIRNLRS